MITTNNEEATTKGTTVAAHTFLLVQDMPVYPLRCAAHTLHLAVNKVLDQHKYILDSNFSSICNDKQIASQ